MAENVGTAAAQDGASSVGGASPDARAAARASARTPDAASPRAWCRLAARTRT